MCFGGKTSSEPPPSRPPPTFTRDLDPMERQRQASGDTTTVPGTTGETLGSGGFPSPTGIPGVTGEVRQMPGVENVR